MLSWLRRPSSKGDVKLHSTNVKKKSDYSVSTWNVLNMVLVTHIAIKALSNVVFALFYRWE